MKKIERVGLGFRSSRRLEILGIVTVVGALVLLADNTSRMRKHWWDRVKLGVKLAELDAPPLTRPWLPTVGAAAMTGVGAVTAALVAAIVGGN